MRKNRNPHASMPLSAALVLLGTILTSCAFASGVCEEQVSETLLFDEIDAIVLEGGTVFDVSVTGSDGDGVAVTTTMAANSPSTVEPTVVDSTLRIACSVDLDKWNHCHQTIAISVPRTTNLQIDTGTGEIRITGVTGTLIADSGTGSITVSDFEGMIRLDSGTGNQMARNLRLSGNSSFDAGTGSVNISLRHELSEFSWDLSSGTGEITLDGLEVDAPYTSTGGSIVIAASTSTGDIEFNGD